MSCTNCYNGCTDTISDQCVKYTGIDIPTLGISTGDPLSVIEQSLITFLLSTLDGTGIKIDLSGIDVCALVQAYLPTFGEISIVDISKALIESACDIQEQVDAIVATLATLNADYTIGCLTGVTSSSDTHAIVQATITKLCSVNSSVNTILDQLPLYVTKSEFCTLLAQCNSQEPVVVASASDKMIPYSAVPYYGPTSNFPSTGDSFNATGAGVGYWNRVFMCNGQNGTPDLRGRVVVGATNTPSTNSFPSQTEPGVNGNPIYDKGSSNLIGKNTTILTLPQIPAHNHTNSTATTIISPNPHTHAISPTATQSGQNISNDGSGAQATSEVNNTLVAAATSLTATTTLTILPQGNNEAHPNVQPGLAFYYIMYIPA